MDVSALGDGQNEPKKYKREKNKKEKKKKRKEKKRSRGKRTDITYRRN